MSSHVAGGSQRFERILVVRTDRLGDVILTLPILPVLRRSFPDAFIGMLLRKYTGEILEGNPYVDELLWYDDGNELVPFNAICEQIKAQHFDAAIVVYPRFRLAWLMYRSGIPVRIGTGYRAYSPLFNRRVYEHRSDAKRHELEYNLNLLKELGCPAPTADFIPEFFLDIPAEAEKRVASLMNSMAMDPRKPTVIVHPGSGGSAREWPPGSFGALADRLIRERGVQVLVTGGRGEEAKASQVAGAMDHQAKTLVGRLTLKELAALIRRAVLFVSNSTGPLHLAVAVGTPVVGLYPQATAMSAKRWGPYTDKAVVFVPDKPRDCADCVGKEPSPCSCMASIDVDRVFRAAVSLLDTKSQMKGEPVTHA